MSLKTKREKIEDYLFNLDATILSLDAENNSNSLEPKLFITTAFFTKKPNKNILNNFSYNFNLQSDKIKLKKIKIKDVYKNNIQPLKAIKIGRFTFLENKNIKNFILFKDIIIPAGLGFGSGHHPTTQGIIYLINKIYFKKNIRYNKIIDVGCGSGILGITLAKLWKKQI